MSDRIKGLVVTLDKPMRDDDVESLTNAILLLKGVSGVAVSIDNVSDHINRVMVRNELIKGVWRELNK